MLYKNIVNIGDYKMWINTIAADAPSAVIESKFIPCENN